MYGEFSDDSLDKVFSVPSLVAVIETPDVAILRTSVTVPVSTNLEFVFST